MSNKIKFLLLLMGASFLLTACQKEMNYSYLIRHPKVLKRELVKCHEKNPNIDQQGGECKLITKTASDLYHTLAEQEIDPEKFGQEVLDTQMKCAAALKELQQAKQTIVVLQNKKAPLSELQNAKNNLAKVENSYQQQHEAAQLELAVIGLSSPE